MITTHTIEKYELQIASLIRQIQDIHRTLDKRDRIKGFSEKNPEKIEQAVVKLSQAQQSLHDAICLLLDSGNTRK